MLRQAMGGYEGNNGIQSLRLSHLVNVTSHNSTLHLLFFCQDVRKIEHAFDFRNLLSLMLLQVCITLEKSGLQGMGTAEVFPKSTSSFNYDVSCFKKYCRSYG